jgi:site-specific DNA-cytosine methylase
MLTNQLILGLAHELVVDLFAGGGGASTGIEQAIGRHVDIAINHDPQAVALHQANHPQTQHHAEVRAFLTAYYGSDQDTPLTDPMHTVTTKPRFGLVTVAGQQYEIADIGMRMLQPRELYRAQGFPDSYVIDHGADGKPLTKEAQVRMCGNSVCPPMAAAIVRANYSELPMRVAA